MTLAEAKFQNVASVGIEAAPMAHFASSVKTDWEIDSNGLMAYATSVAALASATTKRSRELWRLDPEWHALLLLLTNSISLRPLHRVFLLCPDRGPFLDLGDADLLALGQGQRCTWRASVSSGRCRSMAPVVMTGIVYQLLELAEPVHRIPT